MEPGDLRFQEISAAFSLTAEKYDRFAEDHPNLSRMRSKVYAHIMRHLPSGSKILELNAGTGSDALYLAQNGYSVLATDIAPGMLQRIRDKIQTHNLADRVQVQECSFTELEKIEAGPFDAVFSDLGGLNCIPDLRPVIDSLPKILKPDGLVVWVLMPPVCLWELSSVFRADFGFAFRRLSPGGTRAHLEGKYFTIYYFTPEQVRGWFNGQYELLEIEGISIFAPPAESKNLAIRHPRFYRLLCSIDDRLCMKSPFRAWGDFFIISLRYTGQTIPISHD